MSKRITLKFIAEHFNVSVSTVSMALKDSYEISEAMRTKIQNFAKEHNYRPNPFAINLKNKKTKTIGVIIPTILNHFFVKIFSGIEAIANEKGYNIITVITKGDLQKEVDTVNMFKDGFIDGILISVSEETQSKQFFKHLQDFIKEAGPVVMFDRVSDLVQCDKIIVDDFNCAYNATEHLIKTGCKNIAIVSVLDNLGIVNLRINGYKKALSDYGITFNEKLISLIKKDYDFETEIKTLLDYQNVDAIIGLEEYSTIESMIIAESRGYKIPEDISLIGYTNGNLFKYVKPSVTCINQHGAYIGKGKIEKKYNRYRWQVFISATIGYSLFYVCRLSLSVVKKPIVDSGILTDSEIGMVGSALFFTYAIGKLTNGFLADRSNIRRFMTTGLLLTALINLALGFINSFSVFAILWGLSGWFQSMGAAPSVVSLSRWFSNKERGTYYGIWSASHGLGKAITFIVVAFIVSVSGWQWGFWGAGLIGLAGALIVWLFLHDSPESKGLPSIADYKNDHAQISAKDKSVGALQKEVLKNPYIWILALASALMYVSRYGIESWGVYYLEAQKGYTTLEASSIVSVSAVSGIIGTIISGFISDKFFHGSRNVPVLIAGILNVTAIGLFLYYPDGSPWVDTASMVLFGFAIGILITFVGGLMAVDIASKKASGAALGLIGIASYIGAGIQDAVSGYLIGDNHTVLNGVDSYDFSTVRIFWLGAAVLSVICALFVWNAKAKD